MKYFLILLSLLVCIGCSTIKIPEHNLVLHDNLDKTTARTEINQYKDSVIQKANIINSINFSFRGKTMSAIGITKLDAENNNFSVAGFNPMGVTLFKIKMENDKIVSSYVIPQFESNDLKKAADMISKDIARIYFKRKIDLQKSTLNINNYGVTINKTINNNNYEYFFTGKPLRLTTKTMYTNKKKIWSVDYYDYRTVNNAKMPYKIFLKHYKYRYTLDVETKEIKN